MKTWKKFQKIPGGTFVFNQILHRFIPYTGSIHPEVATMEPGKVTVHMKDRRAVRNHLDSIHAVAMMNLAELTTGLTAMSLCTDKHRSILRHFEIDFVKKARGRLTGEGRAQFEPSNENTDVVIEATVRNTEGAAVCVAKGTWRIGPVKST